jgi:hypothetical protein
VYPHIPQVMVEEWRNLHEHSASTDGVPEECQLDSNFDPVFETRHDDDGHHGADFDASSAEHRKSNRPPAYNANFAQRMHQTIEGRLPANSPLWKDYCMFQKDFFEQINRMSHESAGVGASARKRGLPDIAQGRGKAAKATHQHTSSRASATAGDAAQPKQAAPAFPGRTGERATTYLGKYGAVPNWIVEVFPDDEHITYEPGDRWFMQVKNGRVEGPDGAQIIQACRWMKKNSVREVDASYPQDVQCELRNVKGYGPPECPIFTMKASPPECPILNAAASVVHPTPQPCWVPAKTYHPNLQIYLTRKVAASVATVAVSVLRDAMISALVPGVSASSSKHSLIEIMCKYDCEFIARPNPIVRPRQQSLSQSDVSQPAARGPDSANSSDSDAPISRAAYAMAMAAAAAAKKPKNGGDEQ